MEVLLQEPHVRVEVTDDALFHVAVDGEAAPGGLDADEVLDLVQPFLEQRAPVKYLLDASRLGQISLSERWHLAERMKQNRKFIDRSATYGLPLHLEFPLRVILRVSGRKDLRVFRNREEAEQWLLSGS